MAASLGSREDHCIGPPRSPASNAVLKRIAPSLPSGLVRSGSIFIYPNPENASRYVVVWSARLLSAPDNGVNSGWIMPLNLLPDFVDVRDGKVVSGGHFDNEWRPPHPAPAQ